MVVRALRERCPRIQVDALGGPALAEQGATIRHDTARHAVMGLVEVLTSLPRHLALLRVIDRDFRDGTYDLLLAIDYPGFNLRLAERARRNGVPVLYYIAPKHWATSSRLTPRFARAVNQVACILPFEPAFFEPYGVKAEFVGHPLLDRAPLPPREEARRKLGIQQSDRVLAIFPGSRGQEVERMWPAFRDAGKQLLAAGKCHRALVASVRNTAYPEPGALSLLPEQSTWIWAAADAAIVKSGTATLEGALAGVPMVVAYRMNPVTGWIARRMLRVPWISLVNLIAKRDVVPELLQDAVNPSALARAVAPLLEGDSSAVRQRDAFRDVRSELGNPGASPRVASMCVELLDSRT
jgi:lipid-A-disaccharide synthase